MAGGVGTATVCAAATLVGGCLSVGGGPSVNAALSSSPVRRVGGALYVGTFAELVEDRAALQLLYARDFGPLGEQSDDLGTWGGRFTAIGNPGFYLLGTYGLRKDPEQPRASALMLGGGVSLSSTGSAPYGRWWSGVSVGVLYQRQRQSDIDQDRHGHFLGLSFEVNAGYSMLGPMKR